MNIPKGVSVKLTATFYKYFKHLNNRDFIRAIYNREVAPHHSVDLYFKGNTIKNQYLERQEFVLNTKPYKKEDWL